MSALAGKVAVITGAGRGIGRAVSLLFAKAGATIVSVSRSADQIATLSETLRKSGHRAVDIAADVGSEAAWRLIANRVSDEFGRWDILINGAGVDGGVGDLETIHSSTLEAIVRTNLLGTAFGCAAALKVMRREKTGVIINVASGLAQRVQPGLAMYSASKAAVVQLSAALAAEAAPDKVQVFALHPGIVDTEMVREQQRTLSAASESVRRRLSSLELWTPEQSAKLFLLLATGREGLSSGQFIQYSDQAVVERADLLAREIDRTNERV